VARLIGWAGASNIPIALGIPLALLAGGWPELALLVAVAIALWLWCALLGWRRPSAAHLLVLLRLTLLTAVFSLALRYPAVRLHGELEAIRIGGSLLIMAWALRIWLLTHAAKLLLDLGLVARTSGILASSSILGGSILFWLEIGQAGALTGPHTPLQSAHLWWAYTAGVVLALMVPIVLLMLMAVHIMVREQPGDPQPSD